MAGSGVLGLGSGEAGGSAREGERGVAFGSWGVGSWVVGMGGPLALDGWGLGGRSWVVMCDGLSRYVLGGQGFTICSGIWRLLGWVSRLGAQIGQRAD